MLSTWGERARNKKQKEKEREKVIHSWLSLQHKTQKRLSLKEEKKNDSSRHLSFSIYFSLLYKLSLLYPALTYLLSERREKMKRRESFKTTQKRKREDDLNVSLFSLFFLFI